MVTSWCFSFLFTYAFPLRISIFSIFLYTNFFNFYSLQSGSKHLGTYNDLHSTF